MRPYHKVLSEFDLLWEKAQQQAAAFLDPAHALDIKDLNTVVTILKRIQDASRAIQLDAAKLKEHAPDDENNPAEETDAIDDEKLHRILRRLETEGDDADTYEPEPDDEETV